MSEEDEKNVRRRRKMSEEDEKTVRRGDLNFNIQAPILQSAR